MRSRSTRVGILIFCFFLGFFITIQTKNTDSEHAFVSERVLADNKITVEAEKDEIRRLNAIIKDTKNKISHYESEYVSDKEIVSQAEANYEKYKKIAGFTQIQGEGITIFLDDGIRDLYEGESANDIIVHDLDIMIIINELINAGAEAISINGERFTPSTEVSCSGHTVRINGRTHARPFYINAVGDQSTLYAAMTIPGGYGSILTQYGLIFNVNKSDSVVVPASKGNLSITHMIVEEEGK